MKTIGFSALSLFVLVILGTTKSSAQCGPYIQHPFAPTTMGHAYVIMDACAIEDATVLWSTGDTTTSIDVPVGIHSVSFYNGAILLYTDTFEVVQDDWVIDGYVAPFSGSVAVSGQASVPHCAPSIFNYLTCTPDPDLTVLEVIQDDTLVVGSMSPVDCATTYFNFMWLPFGHSYAVHVQSPCGSAYSDTTIAYDCGDMSLQTILTPATPGMYNGMIDVTDIIPDNTTALPYPSPVTGAFLLMDLATGSPLGAEQFGSTASWTGLDTGQYTIRFTPDLVCQSVMVNVDLTLGVVLSTPENERQEALVLHPNPAQERLSWTSTTPCTARVLDLQGRTMIQERVAGTMDVSRLGTGVYVLELNDGTITRRNRFEKR